MNRPLNLFLAAAALAALALTGCNKFRSKSDRGPGELISEARSFVDSLSTHGVAVNYRGGQPKRIVWDLAEVLAINHSPAILAPVVYDSPILARANFAGDQPFHLDYLTQFLFYQDSADKPAALVVTSFPDSNYFKDPTRPFSGIRFVEDWYGRPIQKLLFTADGKIRQYVGSRTQAAALGIIQTCYTIDGYNYSPALGETYTWTEQAGCNVEYIYGSAGGGTMAGSPGVIVGPGGGGGRSASPLSVTMLGGPSVIKSIQAYLQCFTNVGGSDHHYSITICVDEPVPGTRTPWTPSVQGAAGSSSGTDNPIAVGHTFLILTETYGTSIVTRNVGFYPSGTVTPASPRSQGALNDNETHSYNISGSFTVTNAQFYNVLNYIVQGNAPGYLYDLNSNNCTTFAINAVAQAGINLPRTTGTWIDGAGDDPGDLGEDLRKGTVPGMTLNTSGGSQVSHYNQGQCN